LNRSAAPLSQPGVSHASRRHPWVHVPENMPVEPQMPRRTGDLRDRDRKQPRPRFRRPGRQCAARGGQTGVRVSVSTEIGTTKKALNHFGVRLYKSAPHWTRTNNPLIKSRPQTIAKTPQGRISQHSLTSWERRKSARPAIRQHSNQHSRPPRRPAGWTLPAFFVRDRPGESKVKRSVVYSRVRGQELFPRISFPPVRKNAPRS